MTQTDKTRIEVEIYNQKYTIVGKEHAAHMRLVSSLVDQKMRDIKAHNKHLDINRLAVLTAINTMNDYLKLKDAYDQLNNKKQTKEDLSDG